MRAVAAVLLMLAATAGCASGGAPAVGTPRSSAAGTAPGSPAAATMMICADEIREEIAGALGTELSAPLSPHWADHVYSCTYDYGGGRSMRLSVEELPDPAAASARLGRLRAGAVGSRAVNGLGDAAFARGDGSAVALRDRMVLTVDVSRLPAVFGTPPRPRAGVALTVATTVMICWKEH
ncbi:hypothetical protein [Peterkaempfera sp. SMS 1(5)a]|uniref:hypothetical protein n=1 Tax=Peterkaempfera podocarpi TaxID=3232308 RepID=UPI003672A7D8